VSQFLAHMDVFLFSLKYAKPISWTMLSPVVANEGIFLRVGMVLGHMVQGRCTANPFLSRPTCLTTTIGGWFISQCALLDPLFRTKTPFPWARQRSLAVFHDCCSGRRMTDSQAVTKKVSFCTYWLLVVCTRFIILPMLRMKATYSRPLFFSLGNRCPLIQCGVLLP